MSKEKAAKKSKRPERDQRVEIADGAIEQLIQKYGLTPEGIFGEGGLVKALSRRVVEKALEGELDASLVYAKDRRGSAAVATTATGGHEQGAGDRERDDGDRGLPRDVRGALSRCWCEKAATLEWVDEKILAPLLRAGLRCGRSRGSWFLKSSTGRSQAGMIATVTESVLEECVNGKSGAGASYPVVILGRPLGGK
jgi:hypothetical protein